MLEAKIDCILLSAALCKENEQFMLSELHLFAYLACLVGLFQGWSVSQWGYAFWGTEDGAPFSDALQQEFDVLVECGAVLVTESLYRCESEQIRIADQLAVMSSMADRSGLIDASLSGLRFYGSGFVRNAMNSDPVLSNVRKAHSGRNLMIEEGMALLHSHFEKLRRVVPPGSSPKVPSILWLATLGEVNKRKEVHGEH